MTKSDLMEKIAQKTDLSKNASGNALNGFLDAVQEALIKEGKLTLAGFGTFALAERKARKGRNPQTGEEITIPASKVIKFKPGKGLKDGVNS